MFVFVRVQRWFFLYFLTERMLTALILSWPRKSSGVALVVRHSPGFRGQERQRALETLRLLRTLLLFLQVQSMVLPRKQLLRRHLSLCFCQPSSLCHPCLQGQISQWMLLLTSLCSRGPTFLPAQERPPVKRQKCSYRMRGFKNSKALGWICPERSHGTFPTFFHRSLLNLWLPTNKPRLGLNSSAQAP